MTQQKAYKTEISLTPDQIQKLRQTVGVCQFVYNLFISHNQTQYAQGLPYMSGMTFSKYLNNQYRTEHPEHSWIQQASSKAVKQAIMNADLAFKDFFAGKRGFPQFKKKNHQKVKAYFPLNSPTDIQVNRHRIKIPTLGWVKLKEKGYLPTKDCVIKSVTVSQKAHRWYVSLLVKETPLYAIGRTTLQEWDIIPYSEGVGIDLGIKDLAVMSNGMTVSNINKTERVKKIQKQLIRAQRKLSRQFDALKKDKIAKEEWWSRSNYQKQIVKIQKIHKRLTDIRDAHIQQAISQLVRAKPVYVVLEDLNIQGMMKNHHLAKSIQQQKWYYLRQRLIQSCHRLGIEVRVVSRFYPSSKLCHPCQIKHVALKLKDRVWTCLNPQCQSVNERDFNASLNLRDCPDYTVITPEKKQAKRTRYKKVHTVT